MEFKILHKDRKSKARVGKITTAHGIINTPAFVPVGTKATVKGLTPGDLKAAGVQILFGNTYHLHLRPGEDIIKDFGGLAKFMGWNGPTITDSGGFQVFSLGQKKIIILQENEEVNLVNITEDGVVFRSHIDGSKHIFTPEISIEIQKKLGADLILAFDECAPHPSTEKYTKEAMIRTHNWLNRCIDEFNNEEFTFFPQALYGIIQGGVYKELREESAKFVSKKPIFGIAIGGVSVGESKKEMRNVLKWVIPFLPAEKPRHLLGIGEVDDIFTAVENGMDTFDCVIPTRFGRYGIAFVGHLEGNMKNKFRIDLNKTLFAKDKNPISKNCLCYVCATFTRAYIHHLFRAQELLAYRLASYHNMFFINDLVRKIRESILNDECVELKKQWLDL